MDIRSAIKKAKTIGGVITRGTESGFYIEPTNSLGRSIIYGKDGVVISPGWEPLLDDLMATDWDVVDWKREALTQKDLDKWAKELCSNTKKEA
ncbi:hypothetical protein L2722_00250 [Lactobacillus gasseri]|jgi:hypothetical protein|nr:hypothetical protein [Lactobacillus gasseri]MCZ3668560.1 hypothetical protein [Lactobacillus gasseri]